LLKNTAKTQREKAYELETLTKQKPTGYENLNSKNKKANNNKGQKTIYTTRWATRKTGAAAASVFIRQHKSRGRQTGKRTGPH